jgi:ABC-2 type transport system ATP-binding protein
MKLRAISGILNVLPGQAEGSFLLECELGRDLRDEIARIAVLNQWGLLELRTVSMTLEDVFLQLTRHEDHLSEPVEATVSASAERTDA